MLAYTKKKNEIHNLKSTIINVIVIGNKIKRLHFIHNL